MIGLSVHAVSSADPRLVRGHIIPARSLQLKDIPEGTSSYDTLQGGSWLNVARR